MNINYVTPKNRQPHSQTPDDILEALSVEQQKTQVILHAAMQDDFYEKPRVEQHYHLWVVDDYLKASGDLIEALLQHLGNLHHHWEQTKNAKTEKK